LQEVLLRADDSAIDTLFFHVGSRQLVLHLGRCAISVLLGGELGRALER
jgi:hypothetical protein